MIALASRRLGRVEKGQPLLLGTNKTEGGYNFAVEASEDSEVALLLYKKRGTAAPVEIIFPKEFRTGRVWALKLADVSLKDYTGSVDENISVLRMTRKRKYAAVSSWRMFLGGVMRAHRISNMKT